MSLSECLRAKWFALDVIEKVEALEAEIEKLKEENEKYRLGMQENCQLRAEIERLREALLDIANRGVPVQREEHRIARAALNEENKT